MLTASVTFRKCLVNSVEYGSDDRHVGSRVFFDLTIDNQRFVDLSVDVRQRVDTGAEHEPLSISSHRGYSGPFNCPVFGRCLEFYYRHVLGAHALVLGGRGPALLLDRYPLEREMSVQFEVDSGTPETEVGPDH